MALRQIIPEFKPQWTEFDLGKPVPKTKKFERLEFRAGADVNDVIDKIASGGLYELSAATGAGKTTRLPHELAKATGQLVLLIFPYSHMAAQQYQYAKSCGHAVTEIKTLTDEYPDAGVAYVAAATLVAKWMQDGRVSYPAAHVLHDESHESGVFTDVVRDLTPGEGTRLSYTKMSATLDLEVPRRAEIPGSVVSDKYEASSFSDPWTVFESGAPWCVDEMDGNALVFEDDKERANQLIHAFNDAGAVAYRIHSGMAVRNFLGVIQALSRDSHRVNVVIADSTFRSGYTFPVDTIIDNGKIQSLVSEGGRPKLVNRNIFSCEEVQTRGRGGRLKDLNTRYWRPNVELEDKMCDLGPADVDAAAIVYRVLGYAVPARLRVSKFSAGYIPEDLCGALRGALPLGCLHMSQLTLRVRDVSADSTPRVHQQARFEGSAAAFAPAFQQDDFQSFFNDIQDDEIYDAEVQKGNYYHAHGLVTESKHSGSFPYGTDSVLRAIANDFSGSITRFWTDYDKSVAVNCLILSWNSVNLEMRAASAALNCAKPVVRDKDATAVRRWARSCAERLAQCGNSMRALENALNMLGKDFCTYENMAGAYSGDEKRVRDEILADFSALPVRAANVLDVGAKRMPDVAWRPVVRDVPAICNEARTRDKRVVEQDVNIPPMLAWTMGVAPGRQRVRSITRSDTASGSSTSGKSSKGREHVRYEAIVDGRKSVKPK